MLFLGAFLVLAGQLEAVQGLDGGHDDIDVVDDGAASREDAGDVVEQGANVQEDLPGLGIGTPEYVFVYRIKTSDGTENYRISRLPTPTMEGYLFDGWYTDLVGGDKIKPAEYEFQEDGQTLYAHWTPVSGESTAKPEPEAAEQPASTFRLEDHLGEILIVGTTVLVVTLVAMHG